VSLHRAPGTIHFALDKVAAAKSSWHEIVLKPIATDEEEKLGWPKSLHHCRHILYIACSMGVWLGQAGPGVHSPESPGTDALKICVRGSRLLEQGIIVIQVHVAPDFWATPYRLLAWLMQLSENPRTAQYA
jgi:hypothetical protein